MIERPTSVRIGHMLYTIRWSNDFIESRQEEFDAERTLYGYSSPGFLVIGIREDLPPDSAADTLLHEILHQCLAVSGCEPNQMPRVPNMEERVVWAMTGPLLTVLRENPHIVEFLVNCRSEHGSTE